MSQQSADLDNDSVAEEHAQLIRSRSRNQEKENER
jgi:hypothetical protein